jgi:hypothetical protein
MKFAFSLAFLLMSTSCEAADPPGVSASAKAEVEAVTSPDILPELDGQEVASDQVIREDGAPLLPDELEETLVTEPDTGGLTIPEKLTDLEQRTTKLLTDQTEVQSTARETLARLQGAFPEAAAEVERAKAPPKVESAAEKE